MDTPKVGDKVAIILIKTSSGEVSVVGHKVKTVGKVLGKGSLTYPHRIETTSGEPLDVKPCRTTKHVWGAADWVASRLLKV